SLKHAAGGLALAEAEPVLPDDADASVYEEAFDLYLELSRALSTPVRTLAEFKRNRGAASERS
ncbi:MAG: hypothetical protein ACRDNG_01100, partial [Gaiellaceae bacterium]